MVLCGFGNSRGQRDARVVEKDVEVGLFGLKGLSGVFDGGQVREFEVEIVEGARGGGFVVVLCGFGDV